MTHKKKRLGFQLLIPSRLVGVLGIYFLKLQRPGGKGVGRKGNLPGGGFPYPNSVAKQAGFMTVELLSTLVIAAIFIAVFYQIYVSTDVVATRASQLAAVNEVAYRKLQQYENGSFQSISTPGGTSPAQVEEFAAEIPEAVPGPVTAVVNTALLTPTLKAVNVRVDFGESGERIIEYTTYIQESGVGR